MAKKKREAMEQGELNLIPMMNLICLLIPFLLLSAQFIQIGIIMVQTPRLKSPSSTEEKKQKQQLNLTVVMTGKGYYVKSRFGSECPPGQSGEDAKLCFRNKERGKFTVEIVRKLQHHMWYLFKKKYASSSFYEDAKTDRHTLTLVPQHDVKYGDLVTTLDALREIPADAKDPKSPADIPPAGCRMAYDRKIRAWHVKGSKGEDATEKACMFHLVTLAIGAT